MIGKRTGARLLALCLVALSPAPGRADTLQVKPDAPQRYVVVKGDTLWDISERYLDSPWRWPELWRGNPHIRNPHLIYPGDTLSLVYVQGEPRLQITRNGDAPPPPAAPPSPSPAPPPPAAGLEVVKLSPQIRATPIASPIPVVAYDNIRLFLRDIRLLDSAVIDAAPYIIRGEEGRTITARGDTIYAMGIAGATAGDKFHVYHVGKPVRDPDSDEVIAYEGIYVGDAEMRRSGEPATLLLTATKREAAVGDRLLQAIPAAELTDFYPKAPAAPVAAKILNVIGASAIAGRYQSVIINAGARQGIVRGDVLATFAKAQTVADTVSGRKGDTVTLPPERSGTLMVIRPFENLSYALVMESRLPLNIHDAVRSPE